MEQTKTFIEIEKQLWEDFKEASKKDKLRLMGSLEEALKLYIKKVNSQS